MLTYFIIHTDFDVYYLNLENRSDKVYAKCSHKK